MVLRDVLTEERHALLNPEGVHAAAAPIAKLRVNLMQLLVELGDLVPLHVELQAVLADEAHAHSDGLCSGQRKLTPLEGLELSPGQVNRLIQELSNCLFCIGAVDEKHGALARDIFNLHLLVSPLVLLHPPQVMQLEIGIASHVEILFREPHEGQFRIDLASGREQVPEADTADGGQLVRDHTVEEGRCAGTGDAVVRERPISKACMVHDLLALLLHGVPIRRPHEGGPLVLQVHRLCVEPIRGLPAMRKAELAAALLQDLDDVLLGPLGVDHRPRPGHVLVEVVGEIVPAIRLLDLLADPLGRRPGAIARGVRLRELVRRLALQHPMDDVAAQARGMGDAVRLRTSMPKVRLLMRGADKMVAIRRPTRGSVQHRLDARALELRDEGRGILHALHKALHIALEEVVGQLGGHGALPLLGRQRHEVLALVWADEHALALVPDVVGALQVAENRQLVAMLVVVRLDLGNGLGNDILMLQHGARRVHTREASDALRPEACTIDHSLRTHDVDFAVGGAHRHLPSLIGHAVQADDLRVLVNLAAQRLGFHRKGLRHRGGVDVAVALGVQRSQEAIGVDQRVQTLHLLGTDHVHLRPAEKSLVELGLGQGVVRFLHAILVLDEPDRPWLVEGQLDALLVLPLLVHVHSLLMPELEVVATVVVRDETGRVPRGARGQCRLLEDGRGGAHAVQAQVVEDAGSYHTTADDGHIHVAGQVGGPFDCNRQLPGTRGGCRQTLSNRKRLCRTPRDTQSPAHGFDAHECSVGYY
mmetsp:Transcript_47333/g.135716  ORF Transcript_47333/g.135716 Transcript_47333/m.135716 type:complete len:762 (-) Transcript_47333:50-2335(-)